MILLIRVRAENSVVLNFPRQRTWTAKGSGDVARGCGF